MAGVDSPVSGSQVTGPLRPGPSDVPVPRSTATVPWPDSMKPKPAR